MLSRKLFALFAFLFTIPALAGSLTLTGAGSTAYPHLALTRGVQAFGDSLMAGNVAGDGNQVWYLSNAYLNNYQIANNAVGGTTIAQIKSSIQAFDPAVLAASTILVDGLRNDIAVAGFDTAIATALTIPATIGHNNYLYYGMPTAGSVPPGAYIEPLGSLNWSQVVYANRTLQNSMGAHFVNIRKTFQRFGDGTAQATADIATDTTPYNLRTISPGTVDSLHFGGSGNLVYAQQMMVPSLYGVESGAFFSPDQEMLINSSTAQSSGGAVAQAPILGTPDSTAITSSTCSGAFAISSTGAITRANSTTLTNICDLSITTSKSGQPNSSGLLRLYMGAVAGEAPSSVTFTGPSWATQAYTNLTTAQKGSIVEVFSTAAGTDGTVMYLVNNEAAASYSLSRGSDNRISFIGKNSGATTTISLKSASSGVGLITAASGEVAVYISWDLTQATPVTQVYVGSTSSKSQLAATFNETVNLTKRFVINAQNPTGALPFTGTRRLSWHSSTYIDWSDASNRAALLTSLASDCTFTPTAGSPVTPFLCFGGRAGDWAFGQNRGTGGPTAMAIPTTSTIQ